MALRVVWRPCMQALMHAGLCNAGARAANLHLKECLVITRKRAARLSHRRWVSCEHMQQTGWCRRLTDVSLAHSREQEDMGAARLEHAKEQLQACLEAIRHCLRFDLHPAPRAERRTSRTNPHDLCCHREKTLDSGASSGGSLLSGVQPRVHRSPRTGGEPR